MSGMQPTYFVQHPDGSYSKADPQPVLEAQRVALTDEQMFAAIRPLCQSDEIAARLIHTSIDEYRAIERALGIGTKEGGK